MVTDIYVHIFLSNKFLPVCTFRRNFSSLLIYNVRTYPVSVRVGTKYALLILYGVSARNTRYLYCACTYIKLESNVRMVR